MWHGLVITHRQPTNTLGWFKSGRGVLALVIDEWSRGGNYRERRKSDACTQYHDERTDGAEIKRRECGRPSGRGFACSASHKAARRKMSPSAFVALNFQMKASRPNAASTSSLFLAQDFPPLGPLLPCFHHFAANSACTRSTRYSTHLCSIIVQRRPTSPCESSVDRHVIHIATILNRKLVPNDLAFAPPRSDKVCSNAGLI